MIELYTWSTPNGRKVSIALEEMGLPYKVHAINIGAGDQFKPEFLEISPNNKIPAIVDEETETSLMESGAILFYLANKTGQFLPKDPYAYWGVMEWLMWQMGGFGPMLGQAHHFLHFNKGKSDYAENRYGEEAQRLYSVLDKQLGEGEFVAGDYSIADIAIFPWAARWQWQGIDLTAHPNVLRWYKTLAARPAVQRGYSVPSEAEIPLP